MPNSKRSPIKYAPAFGGGIFRPKSEVEGDLAVLERDPDGAPPSDAPVVASSNSVAGLQAPKPTARTNDQRSGETATNVSTPHYSNERTNERITETAERPNGRTAAEAQPASAQDANEATNERTNERTNVLQSEEAAKTRGGVISANDRSNERPTERVRVRHSFDIYQDQLLSLADIQLARHRQNGRKPKLGDLVQEALDAFTASHKQTNDRGR